MQVSDLPVIARKSIDLDAFLQQRFKLLSAALFGLYRLACPLGEQLDDTIIRKPVVVLRFGELHRERPVLLTQALVIGAQFLAHSASSFNCRKRGDVDACSRISR